MSTPKSTITLRILTAVVIMALFAIAPSVSASPANGEPGAGLFIDSPIEGDLDRSGDPTIIRARFVDINFDLLAAADAPQDQSEVGDVVVLNLFDDVAFTALLDRLELNRSGSYSWIGHLEGVAHSQAILVVKDRIVAGNVTLPGALYQVRYAGGGVHALYQIDQAAFPAEAEPIAVDIEAPEEPDVTPTDDGSSIDVMVVYTADARSAEGGTTAMENLIDLSVADANTSYSNSEVTQRLNLVHTAEVTYTETGDSELDLDRLRGTSDGYMDNVHTLRDTYKADMVSLFVDSMSGCGRGYVMQTLSSSFESWAFSVIKRTCAADNHSFAHELGHNMGCAHDRANASVLGVYDYSYGYQDPEEDFRTVMAYDCPGGCPRVQHFSNPDVNYDGQPTGIDHTAADAADNARTLNNTAYTVANFRKSVPDAPTNLVATAVSESQINLTWDDNSSDETSFRLERSPDETNWTEIASVGANVESYSNTGLNCGTTYYYRVRAYRSSDAKYSGYSNTAHDTTSACPSYSISGYVRDPLGSGINGVTVSFSGGPQPDVTTNSSGYYSQSGFSQGTYVVNFSFSLGGYFFSPAEDQVATVGGADATHDATGYPLYPASLPFSDDFESGSLGSAWAVETDYEGRVQVAGDSPRTGSYSLLLDDDTSGGFYSHASAILALNLSSQSQVEMKFWWREFSDENHPDDGVFISDDYGATWYQALSFNDGPSTFTQATIDLDAQASAAGMSFNDHFLVKFQFYDDYPIVSDGYALDDVQVYATGAPPSGYEISGYVRDPLGSGINGITVDFGGSQPSVTTDSSGHYSQSGFDNGDYTVSFSFSLGGYFFSPAEDLVTVSGANATHDASGYPLYPASLPFGDGFESGDLGSAWAVETDYEGRVRVAGDSPRTGSYSLLLDDDTSGGFYSHASAILALNLSSQSQVEMKFWWREFSDENHPDDGVFISDDYGATWYQALSFNDGPSTFTQATIDLDAQASAAGMSFNDHFLVKFQFYDDYPIVSDGYALDDVQVYATGAPPSGYEISGYVRDPLGSGINGITVDFGGSQPSVTTDSSGHYSQSGFDNGDYTVSFSFSLGGYFFSPAEDLVTVSGANATHDASGYPLYPASLPFGDGFESGDLGSAWAVETDYEGRVRVAGDYPRAGSYSLLLDDDTSGGFYSHASAILALDLSGQSQVEMSFWWRGFGDENHPDDGVFISDDYGATWHQALSFNDGPSTFTQATIDLDGQASAAGLTLNDHFLVKFQFYDNYPITSDGYALDDVQVHVPGAQPPDAPTNLAASAVSDSQIDLTWTDNSADEDSFRLERSPDGSMGWTEIASVAANVESYNDSGLSCGDTYYYRVRAHRSDDGQYSNYSNTAHDTTSACPAGYYNISGYVRDSSSTGLSGMTVNFDGVRPAVTTDSSGHYSQSGFSDGAYTVSLSYTGYAFSPVVDQVTVSGTNASHNVTGYPFYPASLPFSDDFESGKLESAWAVETDYQGRVQVAGDSPHTGSYSLLLDDDTSGGFYSHASAILALDLSGQPQVEMSFWWREFNDESHPDDGVFISDDYGATWHQVLSFNGGSSTFTQAIIDLDGQASAAEMSLNDHFLVKFQFYDNYPIVSDGYALDDLLVYVPSAQPPDAPTNLAASAASESQIDLTWTDNSSNEASFHIERGDGSSGWTEIASVPTNTIAYNDTGLACNTTYYYRVRAYNSSDHQYSDYSNTAHDTTSACPSTNYDISGYARDPSSTGLSGATVNFGGVRPAVTTDSSGHYSQSGFSNGAYTVSLSYAGHAFSPVVDQVTVSNTNAIHDVTGYPFYPASLPFSDSFESDNLGSAWAVETDYEGRVRVDSSYPHTGTRSLLLDDDTNKEFYSHASAILALDLSDQSQVEMSFWWREFNDESHPDDGLFISDDYGAAWHQALSFNGGSSTFTQATIDLDAEASAAGLSLNDHFLVKFQFYDNYSIVSDGYALDDVQVYVPGTQENASDVFLPIIQKPPVGRLQIINNTGGTLSVTLSGLGTKTFGAGTSYWENIPAGTYNLTVTTTACPGTISKSITISAGETKTMSFSCGVADVSMTEGE